MESSASPEAENPSGKKPEKVTVTLRLEPRMHEILRRVAFEERVSINRLMMDGLAEVLRQRGGSRAP
jgi:predicted HicB family RNase H-like nuclease